ncbi:MAG: methionyl-tRNA formyltransferase [Clostridia bacterium]|nr:methionyl-tRNA formyltransferase [Clostridia bacterium]
MGTPDFAVNSLNEANKICNIKGVFTQPDKQKGRGKKLLPPPVKEAAQALGIEVFQPNTLKDGQALEILKKLEPDIIIVVAYGKILPKEILEYPKYGCINVHASLLPAYRGAAPIQWAVLGGEKESGITIMQMDEGLDTGDMLSVAKLQIGENETGGSLHDRLAVLGAELLCKTLAEIEAGSINPVKQPDEFTYAPMLTKELCPVDFTKSAAEVHNKIRGLSPYPAAMTMFGDKRLKLFSSSLYDKQTNAKPGEVISSYPLIIACGDGKCVRIDELQLEGGKRMDTKSFLLGRKIEEGTVFGF